MDIETILDIVNKQEYKKFLNEWRKENHPTAQVSDDSYFEACQELLIDDIREIIIGGREWRFYPYGHPYGLLLLDSKGKLPEWHSKRLLAYQIYGKEMGYGITWQEEKGGGGILIKIKSKKLW